jgi:hypothetical protein
MSLVTVTEGNGGIKIIDLAIKICGAFAGYDRQSVLSRSETGGLSGWWTLLPLLLGERSFCCLILFLRQRSGRL